MKRWNIDAPASDQYTEHPEGEWVRYEDAGTEVEAAQTEREELREERDSLCSMLDQARAEVERLRALVTMASESAGTLAGDCTELRDSLAAANALLVRVNGSRWFHGEPLHADIVAHLAAQSAAANTGPLTDAEATRYESAEAAYYAQPATAPTDFSLCISWTGCHAELACMHYLLGDEDEPPRVTALCRACSKAYARRCKLYARKGQKP